MKHIHTIRCARRGSAKYIAASLMCLAKAWVAGGSGCMWPQTMLTENIRRTHKADTWSLHCYIEYRYKNRYLLYYVGLRSDRPLRSVKDKVLFPITAHQSGSVGNIQVKMGGWGWKRKIKGNLTTFITQKEREKSPNIICSITKYFVLTVRPGNTGSSFSRLYSAYMRLKFWNEQTDYINVKLSTFHLHFPLTKQITIHLVGGKTQQSQPQSRWPGGEG